MPSVNSGESEKSYIDRCIPIVLHEGTTKDPSQAAAICHSKWREHEKNTRAKTEEWAKGFLGLSDFCPDCNQPLQRDEEEVWCENCDYSCDMEQ